MRSTGLIFVMLTVLICSCDSEIELDDTTSKKLLKELHYDYDTNELLSEIAYNYDGNGRLLSETVTNKRPNEITVKKYEYSSMGLLTKLVTEFSSGYTFAIIYTYENGLKKVEDKEESTGIYRQLFHYTNSILDSIQSYSINPEMESNWLSTQRYEYENGLLSKESFRTVILEAQGPRSISWDGNYYTYKNGLLQSECLENNECKRYFYNNEGKIIRIVESDASDKARIREEFTYDKSHVLTEKVLYQYSAYATENFIDKIKVTYAYH
jgi:hypothetical protein